MLKKRTTKVVFYYLITQNTPHVCDVLCFVALRDISPITEEILSALLLFTPTYDGTEHPVKVLSVSGSTILSFSPR